MLGIGALAGRAQADPGPHPAQAGGLGHRDVAGVLQDLEVFAQHRVGDAEQSRRMVPANPVAASAPTGQCRSVQGQAERRVIPRGDQAAGDGGAESARGRRGGGQREVEASGGAGAPRSDGR
ncbi:hypothetical protein Apa02nite_021420 [Actinoplanes palleronii]|uniref:Uncharacterized protein n=1 Tax=Actinoplanes palleronii TaxID=113570 RepID=A0ABQ4B5S2_9ACTN|nr:hypothetical protein Apa02nite_021420 [Actinoplanes palleronii]